MRVMHRRCAGLDVHAATVVVALRIHEGRRVDWKSRTFGTTTAELMALAEWLEKERITHAVLEATGVYWKPVWHVLEGRVELILANAQAVRNVPGRKSDVTDACWLADLLAHGLVRTSMVPPEPVQQLRDLTRTRQQFVRERVRHIQRIQKTLEDANIKLTAVVSDVLGTSGEAILRAIVGGESDPATLVRLAHPRLRTPRPLLAEALRGHVADHHRFMLRLHLDHIRRLDEAIAELEGHLARALEPFRESIELLKTAPGLKDVGAPAVGAELGFDMSAFPSADHCVSWAGLCPRLDKSAGKRRSNRLRHGNVWLKPLLVQAAWAAIKTKNSYLRAMYYRLRSRIGPKKAIVAVAASLLRSIYHMLRDRVPYIDLGHDYFDRRNPERVLHRLARRIRNLGYDVLITLPCGAAPGGPQAMPADVSS